MKLEDYSQFGARQVEAGALHNVLAYYGAKAAVTGKPVSEALLFGIGGGIGCGYFVYQSGDLTSLFLATRINSEENAKAGFPLVICERLGLEFSLITSSTSLAAEKRLDQALAQGSPIIVWVNTRLLPYYGTPGGYHTLVVYGLEEAADQALVADRSRQPLRLNQGELAAARQGEGVHRYRALTLHPPAHPLNLGEAALLGLRACLEQMQNGFGPPNFRANFGLAGLEKWADLLIDSKDARGWTRFFPPGPRLYQALTTAYDQIENRGADGRAFRPLFADFLVEASELLDQPRLAGIASLFRDSARLWGELGQSLLPDRIAVFREARESLTRLRTLFESQGLEAGAEMGAIKRRLDEIKAVSAEAFPLPVAEVPGFLAEVSRQVLAIHRVEAQAVAELRELVG